MPNNNSLLVMSSANKQQLFEDVEKAREQQRIADFIKSNKEKRKQETEDMSSLRAHDEKISRFNEPVANVNFPEDEKTTQRFEDEKKEMFAGKMEHMDGNYMDQLEKDLDDYRKIYATIEYTEGKRLAEVRKQLKKDELKKIEDEGRKITRGGDVTDSFAINDAREKYQKTLDRFKDAKIEELKAKNLTGDELKKELEELVLHFGYKEILELDSARSDAKAEADWGAGFRKKCWGALEKASNAYNKLPLWQKIGLSAAAIVSGSGLLIAGKRALGGVVTGVGTAKGLDALHERKMKKVAKDDVDTVLNKLNKIPLDGTLEENKEARYEIMRATLDMKLDNVDDIIRKHKKVALCNKFIGATVGILLGTGTVSKAFSGVINYFHGSEDMAGGLKTLSLNKTVDYGDFKAINEVPGGSMEQMAALNGLTASETGLNPDIDMHVNGGGVAKEIAAASTHDTELRIEKGSSIEKTLIDHIKKIHPDIKNPGNMAHRMWLDYLDDNKEAIINKVGDSEYQKMLKDGMVNVKPGTILSIDEHDPLKLQLHDIEGKISHLNGGHHAELSHGVNHGGAEAPKDLTPAGITDHTNIPTDTADHTPDIPTENPTELPRDAVTDYSRLETEMQAEDAIHEMDQKYSDAMRDANDATTYTSDGPSVEQFEKMGTFNKAREEFSTLLSQMRAEDMPWLGESNVETMIEKGAGSKQILRVCLYNITEGHTFKSAYWGEIKNEPIMKVAYKDGRIDGGFVALLNQFKGIIGDKVLPIDEKETTGQWLARITKLAVNKKG